MNNGVKDLNCPQATKVVDDLKQKLRIEKI